MMSRNLIFLVIPAAMGAFLVAVTSGGGQTPLPATPALPDDTSRFTHIHSLTITDPQSPLYGMHHFYLGDTGFETFAKQRGFPYPPGTTFLGAVYTVASDGAQHNEEAPRMWTMMVKDPTAEDTGGWRFAAFEPDGSRIEQDEASACFACHTEVADTDYVFSRPLAMALPRPATGGGG